MTQSEDEDKPGPVYALIRIPKSGSTSLRQIVRGAFPDAKHFEMIGKIRGDGDTSFVERIRATRKERRRLLVDYATPSFDKAWQIIESRMQPGDIVSGHFGVDEIQLPRFTLRRMTLLRDPVDRLLSDYNYARMGYQKRNAIRRLYHRGRLAAAGKYSFAGYLRFLLDHKSNYSDFMTSFIIGESGTTDPLAYVQSNYFHFGVVEKMDLFCAQFGEKIGQHVASAFENQTARRTQLDISQEERRLAEEVCAGDLELYEAVNASLT